MKHRTLPSVALLSLALTSAATAQETLKLYSDKGTTEMFDFAPGTATIYVVHDGAWGYAGVNFRIAPSAGFTGVWLSDYVPHPSYGGTTPTGIMIWYDGCASESVAVAYVTYAVFGTSETCSHLDTAGASYGEPVTFDCLVYSPYPLAAGKLDVNCSPVPVRALTWGGIKALYR